MSTFRMIGIVAKELMGRPDAHVASVRILDLEHDGFDGVKVEICDAPLKTKGALAGKPNWRKATNTQVRILSTQQLDELIAAWSERTGLCAHCDGTGRVFVSWRHDEGTRYEPCSECNATGSRDGVTISGSRQESLFEVAP